MSRVETVRSFVVLAAVASTVAMTPPTQRQVEISAYYNLIRDYRQGRAEAAIDALVELRVDAAKPALTGPDPHWSADDMNAAALLETEAGFRGSNIAVLSARLSNADLWLTKARKQLVSERLDTRRQDE